MMMAWGYLRFFILLMLESFLHPEQQLTIVDGLKKPTHHNNWFHHVSSCFIYFHPFSFCIMLFHHAFGNESLRSTWAAALAENLGMIRLGRLVKGSGSGMYRCRHSLKLCRSLEILFRCLSQVPPLVKWHLEDVKWCEIATFIFCGLFSSAKINPSILFSITSQLWRLGWAQLVVCSIQITAPERYKICYCVWGCPSPWDMWPEIKKNRRSSPRHISWTYMIYIDLPVWIPSSCGFQEEKCKRHIETPHHRSSFSILCKNSPLAKLIRPSTSCSVHQGLLSVSMRRTLQKRCM